MSDLDRTIRDDIAGRRDELVELLSALVAFDTTAWQPGDPPRDEAALQAFVGERLDKAGFDVDIWEPDPEPLRRHRQVADERFAFTGRPQLSATLRRGGKRRLLLCGHVDVVSAEPEGAWTTPPRAASVRDGLLYGRGAADMKGGVASMIVAAEALARSGAPVDLVVCTVTDEEATGAGSIATVTQKGIRADGGIIPEPTGFDVWVACRGDVIPTIVVPGRPGHAGVAQPPWREGGAVNAIEKGMHVLAALKRLHEQWQDAPGQRHRYLSPGHVLPVKIDGGEWVVTHPAECRLTVHVTYLPGTTGEQTMHVIERTVQAAAESDPDGWLAEHPPLVQWSVDIPPAEVADDDPVVAAVQDAAAALGMRAPLAGLDSWHDGATFTLEGATPTVCWGPRGLDVAHAVDEHVPVDDLVTCAQGLALAALRFSS